MSTNPYRVYTYLTAGGDRRTVECDKVDFTTHHVVFLDTRSLYPTIVLAEHADSVHQLSDITPRTDGTERYRADRRLGS